VGNDKFLVLKKIIHGLVQSTRQFYVKFVKALKLCGSTRSLVYTCLWVKKFNSGIVMMGIYVDDYLTIGSDQGIKEIIEDLKNMILVLRLKNTKTA
jgi:hypothetical protein